MLITLTACCSILLALACERQNYYAFPKVRIKIQAANSDSFFLSREGDVLRNPDQKWPVDIL